MSEVVYSSPEEKTVVGEKAIVVVDAFSTGELLANHVKDTGLKLVLVYSQPKQDDGVFSNKITNADAEIYHSGNIARTAATIEQLKLNVVCVIPGTELGVHLADALMEEFQLNARNPLNLTEARRNKWLQHQTIGNAGVRAAKQILSSNWEEIEEYLEEWSPTPFKVIVKPNQSAGSEDVFLCKSTQEVLAAFNCIDGAINSCGETNEGVLVMEYLEGEEYVVDSVSRDGVHKAVSIWKYDKRQANGQFNVYFGMEVRGVVSDLELSLVQYSNEVLNALQINNGPSHMEIIVTPTGPCLVEVGARCHGGHGTWASISEAAFGYTQITATVDAYVNRAAFDMLPQFPLEPRSYGKEVFLVNYRDGIIRDIPGVEKVESLLAFRAKDISVEIGHTLRKTIDLFTMPGRVQLLHESKEQVESDFKTIHRLLSGGEFFELVSSKALLAFPECPAEAAPEAGPEE